MRGTVQAYSNGALERVKTFKGLPKQGIDKTSERLQETQ